MHSRKRRSALHCNLVMLFLVSLAFAVLLPTEADAQRHKITVSAPNRDYIEAPVSVTLPTGTKVSGAALRRTDNEQYVQCQVLQHDGGAEVTWILRDLKKGDSRTYELTLGKPAPIFGIEGVLVYEADEAVRVDIEGQLFTRYYYQGVPKPVLWPIIGPTGKSVTRSYPMTDALEGEREDHHHHRGLWWTHGNINGTDFWSESSKSGREVHREFVELAGGPVCGIIKTRNDWMVGQWEQQEPRTVDGVHLDAWQPVGEPQKLCEDEREVRVYRVATGRLLDYTITIRATDRELVFGDTKEGSFGMRLAGRMDVDAKLGGRIVNSNGQTDGEAWGKAAEWCDYYGPVDDKTVGVAILDHPTSFRHPTTWHVRTYGLFAANPFGLHDFLRDENKDLGNHTVPPGESITFKYRIFIHEGDTEAARVADAYGAYADPPKIEVK